MNAQRVQQLRFIHKLRSTVRRHSDEIQSLIKEGLEMGVEVELVEVVSIMSDGKEVGCDRERAG